MRNSEGHCPPARFLCNYWQTKLIYCLLGLCIVATPIYLHINLGDALISWLVAVTQSLCTHSWALQCDMWHQWCTKSLLYAWASDLEQSGFEVRVPLGAWESDLPNRATPVSLGWQWWKQAQSSLGSSVGGWRCDWWLRGVGSEWNATGVRGIGQEWTENWGKYWGALPSGWKLTITIDRLILNTIYLVHT